MAVEKGDEEPIAKLCNACAEELPKEGFSKKQWLGSLKKQRRCKGCVDSKVEVNDHPAPETSASTTTAVSKKKGKKNRQKAPPPVYAGNQEGVLFKPTAPSQDFQISLASDICAWCGKTEENEPFHKCGNCKNILYCSQACQKASWPDHKKTCGKMKDDRKNSKKERKAQNKSGSYVITEASGTGNVGLNLNPKSISTIRYGGELRNHEESGTYLASEATADALKRMLGNQKFRVLLQSLEQQSMQARASGQYSVTFMFTDVEELAETDLFLLSCGPLKDIDRAKSLLPSILNQIRISGLMPNGKKPNIGDITPRGYQLNALEWASRRGNYEIAEWLATDPRTSIMLTRTDSAPVAWACYTNHVELARMLIEKGANSKATTEIVFDYKPPLHLAGENGKLLAVRFLVEECGHDIRDTLDLLGQDLRASIRRYNKVWADNPGCVAVDDYAKRKGVEGNIVRMSKKRTKEIELASKNKIAEQQQNQEKDGASKWTLRERVAEAERLKASGTALFTEKRFEEGAASYEEAALFSVENGITGNAIPENERPLYISCLNNTAMCYIKLQRWQDAVSTCGMVLAIESERYSNIKALYRRGLAHLNLGSLKEAKDDLMDAYKIDNSNKDVRKALKQLKEVSLNAHKKREKHDEESILPMGLEGKTKEELAIFYHATLGYPEVETFCEAIDAGFLASFPGLTSSLIRNHLPIAQQK